MTVFLNLNSQTEAHTESMKQPKLPSPKKIGKEASPYNITEQISMDQNANDWKYNKESGTCGLRASCGTSEEDLQFWDQLAKSIS